MIKNPCYNRKTKTDCKKRKPGCHATCKEWAIYQAAKNEEYRRRKFEFDSGVILFEAIYRMKKRQHKKTWHTGDNYKKK